MSTKFSAPIFVLPTELQVKILSYLSLRDQIRVTKACRYWGFLLLETLSLKRSRYRLHLERDEEPGLGTHRLLSPQYNGGSHLRCTFKDWVMKDIYLGPKHETVERALSPSDPKRHEEREYITDCPFLDEPIYSPPSFTLTMFEPETDQEKLRDGWPVAYADCTHLSTPVKMYYVVENKIKRVRKRGKARARSLFKGKRGLSGYLDGPNGSPANGMLRVPPDPDCERPRRTTIRQLLAGCVESLKSNQPALEDTGPSREQVVEFFITYETEPLWSEGEHHYFFGAALLHHHLEYLRTKTSFCEYDERSWGSISYI
ncbi:hypothetical protein ABW21_db0204174 [Orbilia brochopaga]|nr:hypothetical protein ABW21_db0204174 [Drechslerella brochopaga]